MQITADKIKPVITAYSVGALALSALFKSKGLMLILTAFYLILSLVFYYKCIRKLAAVSPQAPIKKLNSTKIFLAAIVVAILVFAVLIKLGKVSATETSGQVFMACLVSLIMLVFGQIAPKLPANAVMGLRLPWTLSDTDTWIVAHRIWNEVSIPSAILCFAGIFSFSRVEGYLLLMLLIWILIPAAVSHTYIMRKWKGKI